jgi:hypothetical protein
MQIVYGPYPMTVAQLAAWAEEQSHLTERECAHALYRLDYPRTITLRKV